MVAYQKICTRGRTIYRLRPVLLGLPFGVADVQSLPPWGWCPVCGREVFDRGERLCRRCRGKL